MAEFLGKPGIKREDISEYMRDQDTIVEYFLNEMKPRMHFVMEHETFAKLEKAIEKKFGFFSAENVKKAGQEALKEWIEKNL